MPHFTVQITEETLDGAVEPKIIRALTEAMVTVYGEDLKLNGIPLRHNVVVGISGIPQHRWGIGGSPTSNNSPIVTLNIREPGLAWPTIEDVPARLIESITDAMAGFSASRSAKTSPCSSSAHPQDAQVLAGKSCKSGIPGARPEDSERCTTGDAYRAQLTGDRWRRRKLS